MLAGIAGAEVDKLFEGKGLDETNMTMTERGGMSGSKLSIYTILGMAGTTNMTRKIILPNLVLFDAFCIFPTWANWLVCIIATFNLTRQ